MNRVPESIAEFLAGTRIVVAGVSRTPAQPANAIFRKLRDSGYDVVPLNPHAQKVEGARCYEDLRSVPDPIDGVVVATHPDVSEDIVRQCAGRGVEHVWIHRSIGQGSVSDEAIREAEAHGLKCIVGGCPMMYCEPVDIGHKCMRWWLRLQKRIPR